MTGKTGPAGPAADSTGESMPLETRFPLPSPIDLQLSLAVLRHGRDDPTIRITSADVALARSEETGPASLRLFVSRSELVAQAWGPGAAKALEMAPAIAGLLDDPSPLKPAHPIVRELAARFATLRFPRTGQLLPNLIPAVTEQKVTGQEAHEAYVGIVGLLGRPAPGPLGLRLPPATEDLAALPYYEFHPFGLERRRAEVLKRIGELGARIESWMALTPAEARVRLQSIPGIGPWTAAEATRAAFGDPDAVSIGDFHLPDLVAWALAREPRADDARMLELLEPYAGQRARVVRLLEVSGIRVPRFGPRFAPRHIGRI